MFHILVNINLYFHREIGQILLFEYMRMQLLNSEVVMLIVE